MTRKSTKRSAHRPSAACGVGLVTSRAGLASALGGIPGYEVAETTDESPARLALIQQLTAAFLRNALYPGDTSWKTAATALENEPNPLGKLQSK